MAVAVRGWGGRPSGDLLPEHLEALPRPELEAVRRLRREPIELKRRLWRLTARQLVAYYRHTDERTP